MHGDLHMLLYYSVAALGTRARMWDQGCGCMAHGFSASLNVCTFVIFCIVQMFDGQGGAHMCSLHKLQLVMLSVHTCYR